MGRCARDLATAFATACTCSFRFPTSTPCHAQGRFGTLQRNGNSWWSSTLEHGWPALNCLPARRRKLLEPRRALVFRAAGYADRQRRIRTAVSIAATLSIRKDRARKMPKYRPKSRAYNSFRSTQSRACDPKWLEATSPHPSRRIALSPRG